MSSLGLDPGLNMPTQTMVQTLSTELGGELVSVYLVSPLDSANPGLKRLLVVLFDTALPVWEHLRPLCRQFWHRHQIQVEICAYTPWLEYLQAHPLEQMFLQRQGRCIWGDDILAPAEFAPESLRQDLEAGFHALHSDLRQKLLQETDGQLAHTLEHLHATLVPLLEGLLVLRGLPLDTPSSWLSKAYGLEHAEALRVDATQSVLERAEYLDLFLQEMQEKLSWMSESSERGSSSLLTL